MHCVSLSHLEGCNPFPLISNTPSRNCGVVLVLFVSKKSLGWWWRELWVVETSQQRMIRVLTYIGCLPWKNHQPIRPIWGWPVVISSISLIPSKYDGSQLAKHNPIHPIVWLIIWYCMIVSQYFLEMKWPARHDYIYNIYPSIYLSYLISSQLNSSHLISSIYLSICIFLPMCPNSSQCGAFLEWGYQITPNHMTSLPQRLRKAPLLQATDQPRDHPGAPGWTSEIARIPRIIYRKNGDLKGFIWNSIGFNWF